MPWVLPQAARGPVREHRVPQGLGARKGEVRLGPLLPSPGVPLWVRAAGALIKNAISGGVGAGRL